MFLVWDQSQTTLSTEIYINTTQKWLTNWNISLFKVAWLRVDTQTILTIQSHVITKNHRIAVTHTEHRNWYLHIRDVRQSDMGWYMCQINTDPMKSQVGYLNVVGKKATLSPFVHFRH